MVTLVQVGGLKEGPSSSKEDLEICGEEGKVSSGGFDTGDREGKDTMETDLESGRKGRGTRWKAGLLVHSQHSASTCFKRIHPPP